MYFLLSKTFNITFNKTVLIHSIHGQWKKGFVFQYLSKHIDRSSQFITHHVHVTLLYLPPEAINTPGVSSYLTAGFQLSWLACMIIWNWMNETALMMHTRGIVVSVWGPQAHFNHQIGAFQGPLMSVTLTEWDKFLCPSAKHWLSYFYP